MIRRLLINEVYNNLVESLDFKNIQTYDFKYNGESKNQMMGFYYSDYRFYVDELDANVDVLITKISRSIQVVLPPKLRKDEYFENGNIIALDYTIEGDDRQYAKSEYKILIKILKTIKAIYEEYMSENEVYAIAIGASEKSGDSKQKILIYKTLAKFKPSGWVDVERRVMGQDALIVYDPSKF